MKDALKRWTVDGFIIGLVIFTSVTYLGLVYVTGYQHTYLLGLTHGEVGADARATPLTIDLPLLALSLTKLVVVRMGYQVPRWHWLNWALWFGVIATVAANFYFGWSWGLVGALLAAVPAVFMGLMVEAIMLVLRVTAELAGRKRKEAADRQAAEEAERAARLAANSERGKKAAETRKRRSGDPGAVQDEPPVDEWAAVADPTQQVPALTGIGLSGGQ